jgi:UDP-glucuronate 4-epimerase
LYAATKKTNELYAHTYHHLYDINCTGLRFFTVYGPYGRPDMALFKFVDKILQGKPIEVYNHGDMQRDFTYVTDIVAGVLSALDNPFPYEIFNLGNNKPIKLNHFIEIIEKTLGKKTKKKMMGLQPGDVLTTYADIKKAKKMLGYDPKTSIEEGVMKFVKWYKEFYNVK